MRKVISQPDVCKPSMFARATVQLQTIVEQRLFDESMQRWRRTTEHAAKWREQETVLLSDDEVIAEAQRVELNRRQTPRMAL
jgi:hypothetical protein